MENRKIIVDEPHHSVGSFDQVLHEKMAHAVIYAPRASTAPAWQLPAVDVAVENRSLELKFSVTTGTGEAVDFSRFLEADSRIVVVECDDDSAIMVRRPSVLEGE